MISPGGWLVSSVLFFCLPVKLKLWGEVALPDHAGWSEILISPADSCVTFQLPLLGQILPQWGGEVQVWMLPSCSGDQLCSPLVALLWRWLFAVLVYWGFHTGSLFLCPTPFLCSISPLCCQCVECSLFVFQFCRAVWLWVLLTGSGDELCDLLPALLWGVAYRQPTLHLPASPVFVYW
jgi:hypothetical protein